VRDAHDQSAGELTVPGAASERPPGSVSSAKGRESVESVVTTSREGLVLAEVKEGRMANHAWQEDKWSPSPR